MPKKPKFKPPPNVFLLFDTTSNEIVCGFPSKEKLNNSLEITPLMDDEVLFEYTLKESK